MKKRLVATLLAPACWVVAQGVELPPIPEGTADDIPVAEEVTVITSERLSYDASRQVVVFENDVVVSDPHLRMKADKLTVFFDEKNQPRRLVAEGRVVMSQGEIRAWAGRVSYDVVAGQAVMEGQPRVMRGRDMLMGERITYWRESNRLESDRNARLVLYPGSDSSLRDRLRGGR